jgi:hypothetical protein
MLKTAQMTVDEATNYFAALGYDAEITTQKVP